MNFIKYFLIIILWFSCASVYGQNLILDERTTADYLGYLNQMKAVESSLHKGTINPNLEVAKNFILSDSLFDRLSNQFKKIIPSDYFTKDIFVFESEIKGNNEQGQYIKWTYGSVTTNDVKTFAELVVSFEVNMEGEGVKFPKVKKIEIRSAKIVDLNKDEIIKEYTERKAKAAKLPLPPGH